MLKTRITELFGIQYPIIQSAMGNIPSVELVAAVSNAGGLGVLASATLESTDELRAQIRKVKSLTNKPFAVNINLFPAVRPLDTNACIDIAAEEGVKIVESSGRSPEPFMEHFKRYKLKVMHKVAGVRFAQTAERLGVDAVAQIGFEGAGHPGMDDVSTLILIPRTVDTVKIPVVAGGGISDARGFVAALALGAEGVLMGTRFLATQECLIHPALKEWLLKARETDTIMIQRSLRDAHRVMKTPTAYRVLGLEARNASLEELLTIISGANTKQMVAQGDMSVGILACGQAVGLVNSIPTCKEVIDGMVSGAQEIWKRWQSQGLLTR